MDAIELWDHQLDAVDLLREARRNKKTRIVLQAPPGAGKTEVAVELTKAARSKGRAVAFTVPYLTLVDQALNRFELRGIPSEEIAVMQAQHPRTDEKLPIQIVSVQTLNNRAYPLADVVLVDECHLQYACVKRWMAACPDITFVGLSATPWAKGMADDWHQLIVVETITGLIEKKILSPFRTFAPPQRPNLDGVRIDNRTSDYAEGELSEVMQEHRLVADVVATWLDKAEGRPTLCYAVDRAHAAALTDQFTGAGVRAKYIDAFTEQDERAAYINELKTGETQVIVSIGTLTTGVDIPWVQCVSFVRPTRSEILFVQSICRGLRAYEGKTDCLILDHSMTTSRMGLVSEIGFSDLRPGKTPKGESVSRETPPPLPRECPSCHFMIPPKVRLCPECGFECKPQSQIEYEDGELVEVGLSAAEKRKAKANREWTVEQKARFFGELKSFGIAKSYSQHWASNQYKDRFGVWPNDPRIRHAPEFRPSHETLLWIREKQMAYAKAQRASGMLRDVQETDRRYARR
jgi:superfamily II DNA or RNA helicase